MDSYSRRIGWLRRGFLGLAVILSGGLIFSLSQGGGELDWGVRDRDHKAKNVEFLYEAEREGVVTLRMEEGVQSGPERIDAQGVAARFLQEDGREIEIKAEKAYYDLERRVLFLESDLRVSRSDGTYLETSRAAFDLETRVLSGGEPTVVSNAYGSFRGSGFKISEDRIILYGEKGSPIEGGEFR